MAPSQSVVSLPGPISGGGKSGRDTYEIYVAYMRRLGREPLSEDAWLESIMHPDIADEVFGLIDDARGEAALLGPWGPRGLTKLAEPVFGFIGTQGDTRIFEGSERVSQGVAVAEVDGVEYCFILQTTTGDSGKVNERKRICWFPMPAQDGPVALAGYTAPLALGHQLLSPFFDADGALNFVTQFTHQDGHEGTDTGKGVAVIKWRWGETSQADVRNIQLFGYAGSGHRFSVFHTASPAVSLDGKRLVIIAPDLQAVEPAAEQEEDTDPVVLVQDTTHWMFIYDFEAVRAANQPLNIDPLVRVQVTPSDRGERVQYTQGVAITPKGLILVQRGYSTPRGRHVLLVYDQHGNRLPEFETDAARAPYSIAQLAGSGGPIAASFEPEGIAWRHKTNSLVWLGMDEWRQVGDVVAFEGGVYAAKASTTSNPRHELYWVPTVATPTMTAWIAPKTGAVSFAPGTVLTWPGHGLVVNTPIRFATDGALPGGVTAGATYYVRAIVDATSFSIAATRGGTAIAVADAGSGVHSATVGFYAPGAYTRKAKTVWEITFDRPGAYPFDTGKSLRPSGASQHFRANAVDGSFRVGDFLRFMAYSEVTELFYPAFEFTGSRTLGLYDHRPGADLSKRSTLFVDRLGRDYFGLRAKEAIATGAWLNLYGAGDPQFPNHWAVGPGGNSSFTLYAGPDGIVKGQGVKGGGHGLPNLGLLLGIGQEASLIYKGRLTEANQLNALFEGGVWGIETGAIAALIGAPVTSSGGLVLVLPQGTPTSERNTPLDAVQIYIQRTPVRMFMRRSNGGAGAAVYDATWTEFVTTGSLLVPGPASRGLPVTIHASGAPVEVTGEALAGGIDGPRVELASVTIPAGCMGPNGFLEIDFETRQTNNSNQKGFYVTLGGTTIHYNRVAPTSSRTYRTALLVQNRGALTSQYFRAQRANGPYGGSGDDQAFTAAIDMSASRSLVVSCSAANPADVLSLERLLVRGTYMP